MAKCSVPFSAKGWLHLKVIFPDVGIFKAPSPTWPCLLLGASDATLLLQLHCHAPLKQELGLPSRGVPHAVAGIGWALGWYSQGHSEESGGIRCYNQESMGYTSWLCPQEASQGICPPGLCLI